MTEDKERLQKTYDVQRVREGLALIKVSGDTSLLDTEYYTSADIREIMSHVRWLVGSDKIEIGKDGERILNELR